MFQEFYKVVQLIKDFTGGTTDTQSTRYVNFNEHYYTSIYNEFYSIFTFQYVTHQTNPSSSNCLVFYLLLLYTSMFRVSFEMSMNKGYGILLNLKGNFIVRGYPFRGFKSIGLELNICQTKWLNQFFLFS